MTAQVERLLLEPRRVKLTTRTGIEVRRTLPHKNLRMIGAWCFVDHFGPTDDVVGMSVAAHPHTGLQTATWLFEGSVTHNDSLGSRQVISPGAFNLMTAGRGISHSELSAHDSSPLSGVQLWIALPDSVRGMVPVFAHHSDLPEVHLGNSNARVFIGQFLGMTSPAVSYSPLVGVELKVPAGESVIIPLNETFEYGLLAAVGSFSVAGQSVACGKLIYNEPGSTSVEVVAHEVTTIILLGGEPFGEKILMWWNFIGRTHEEIVEMRDEWESASTLFGTVSDDLNERIPAPEMPNVRLSAR